MRRLAYLGATSYCELTDRDEQWANRLACSFPSSAGSASHRSLSDLGRRAFQRIWRSVIEPAGALSFSPAGGKENDTLLSEISRQDSRLVKWKASRTIAWSTAANAVEGLCATASCSAIVRHTVNSLTSLSGSGFTIPLSALSASLDAVHTGAPARPVCTQSSYSVRISHVSESTVRTGSPTVAAARRTHLA